MLAFIRRLLLGHNPGKTQLLPAYTMQRRIVQQVWQNQSSQDYGLERLVRLFLAVYPFITLGLFVRFLFAKGGLRLRNIAIEVYVCLKLWATLYVLFYTTSYWLLLIPIYLGLETVMYVFSLIFLADIQPHPIFIRRTILLILINFLELISSYACLYKSLERTAPGSFKAHAIETPAEGISALYFSCITASGIGYGDIFPFTNTAKILVMSQIGLSFVFVVLFISYFTGRFSQHIHQQSSKAKTKSN